MLKAGGLIVSDNAFVAVPTALSVTLTVKLLDPAVPGVPEIVPPAARAQPRGQRSSRHRPRVRRRSAGSGERLRIGSSDRARRQRRRRNTQRRRIDRQRQRLRCAPAALSVTFTVKLLDPAVPGVPEIVPPADRAQSRGQRSSRHRPRVRRRSAGSRERLRIAVPTVPAGSDDVVIAQCRRIDRQRQRLRCAPDLHCPSPSP